MTYGAYFIADDGTLLVSSEQPCYEWITDVAPSARSGNVNTYYSNVSGYPLVFINIGPGGYGGLLAVEGGSGAWTISVLANAGYNISLFQVVGGTPNGYGLATYNSGGGLCFDSTRRILNSKKVTSIGYGLGDSTPYSTMVSYTSGQVRTESSYTDSWVYVNSYVYTEQVYSCTTQIQTSCTTSTTCSPDGQGGQYCFPITTCSTYPVTTCGFSPVTTFYDVYARVRTTNWYIDRGVAHLDGNGTGIGFDFLRHKDGFYKQVLYYAANTTSIGSNTPPGYSPPPTFAPGAETFQGELTKNNVYPYTQTFNNLVNLTCITANRSDYD